MSAIAFIGYAFVSAAACAVLARCVEFACEARRLPQRWVWLAAIGVSVALPLSTLLRRPTAIAALDEQGAARMEREGAVRALPNATVVSAPRNAITVEPPRTAIASAVPKASPAAWIARAERFVEFALGGSLLVVPLLALREWAMLARTRRRWQRGKLNGVPVLISKDFGPAVVGVLDPQIVVPLYVDEMSTAAQRLILAHEQEHIRAGDGLTAQLALWCVALAAWNPLLWWQYLRLRQAIELDCDARVVYHQKIAHGYGALLLEIAARASRSALITTAFLEPARSSLHRRIAHLTRATRRVTRAQWAIVAALGAAAVLAVGVMPRPVRQAPARTAVDFVAENGALTVWALARSGRLARAESVATRFIAEWPPERGIDESCLALVALSDVQLRRGDFATARRSLQRFDRECAKAVYTGFLPQETYRIREELFGPDAVDSVRRTKDDGSVNVGGSVSQIAQLLHNGYYAVAERAGRAFFESFTRHRGAPDWCAVHVSRAFAKVMQGHPDDAQLSLDTLEVPCAATAPHDSLPITTQDVQRLMRGESLAKVLPAFVPPARPPEGQTVWEVMQHNREQRYEDAITIGRVYLGSGRQRLGEPEACAVHINVTYALALQKRFPEARASMTQFDRACAGVRYSTWLPVEADRVRRVVNGEAPNDVYHPSGPRVARQTPVSFTKWGLPQMPYVPYRAVPKKFATNEH